jgi:hypothetical protein
MVRGRYGLEGDPEGVAAVAYKTAKGHRRTISGKRLRFLRSSIARSAARFEDLLKCVEVCSRRRLDAGNLNRFKTAVSR